MLIRCPECEFEREINTANIPPTASLATCPRCGSKFRFRDPETGMPVYVPESSPAPLVEEGPALRHVPGKIQDGQSALSDKPESYGEPDEAATPAEPAVSVPHLPTEMEGDDPLPPGAVIPRISADLPDALVSGKKNVDAPASPAISELDKAPSGAPAADAGTLQTGTEKPVQGMMSVQGTAGLAHLFSARNNTPEPAAELATEPVQDLPPASPANVPSDVPSGMPSVDIPDNDVLPTAQVADSLPDPLPEPVMVQEVVMAKGAVPEHISEPAPEVFSGKNAVQGPLFGAPVSPETSGFEDIQQSESKPAGNIFTPLKKPSLDFSSPDIPDAEDGDEEESMYRESSNVSLGWQDMEGDVVPWEEPGEYGFIGSLYHTLLRALFQPAAFFRAVGRSDGSLARPAAFYILIVFFSSLFDLIWTHGPLHTFITSTPPPGSSVIIARMMDMVSVPLFLIMVPFVAIFLLLVISGIYYGFLKLAQPDDVNFATATRVVAYSAAPRVLFLVPFLGAHAGSLWALTLSFVGCKFAFGMSWGRTALALVPLFLLGFALNLRLVPLLATLFG